ncbi:MAG TPA: RING-HC finger protein [Clostridiaceae bacterium]|nr:RING-HC finger protein [Clostridiaceae bacterium]
MAYCVRCGVELQKGCKACPLCNTEVILPDEIDPSERVTLFLDRMPRNVRPSIDLVPSKSFLLLVTFIILLPILVTLFVDITVNRTITWSFYPITSLALLWLLIAYPAIFKGHTVFQIVTMDMLTIAVFLMSLDMYSGSFPKWSHYPALSLLLVWVYLAGPVAFTWKRSYLVLATWFLGTAGFLFAIDLLTGEARWFLQLALPILVFLTVAAAICVLMKNLYKNKPLLAAGITLIIAVIVFISIDALVNLYVSKLNLTWSPITAAVFVPTAVFLFIVHRNDDLKAYLIKKFHV